MSAIIVLLIHKQFTSCNSAYIKPNIHRCIHSFSLLGKDGAAFETFVQNATSLHYNSWLSSLNRHEVLEVTGTFAIIRFLL